MSNDFDAIFNGFPPSKSLLVSSKTFAISLPPPDKCPVDLLPDELLSSIFELGTNAENWTNYETGHLEEAVVDVNEHDENEWEDVDDDEKNDAEASYNCGSGLHDQTNSLKISGTNKTPELSRSSPSPHLPSAGWGSDSNTSLERIFLPFQVLISHVCKRWRRVSLSNPGLWTKIDFSDERPPFHRAASYIARSQQLPLEICIDCTIGLDWSDSDSCSRSTMSSVVEPQHVRSGERHLHVHDIDKAASVDFAQKTEEEIAIEGHESDALLFEEGVDLPILLPSHIKPLMDLLSPHVQRWRSFELHVPYFSYAHILLHIMSRLPPAPLLEVLQIYHREDVDEDSHSIFDIGYYVKGLPHTIGAPFSGQAKNIKSVVLWGVHVDWEAMSNMLVRLNELELAYHAIDVRPSWTLFEKVLRGSPDLKHLSLHASGPRESTDQWVSHASHDTSSTDAMEIPQHLIPLKKLETVVFAYLPPDTVVAHLKRLYMPALRSLTLDLDQGDCGPLISQLAGPATRPFHINSPKPSSLLSQLRSVKLDGLRWEGDPEARAADTLYQQMTNVRFLELTTLFLHQQFVDRLCEPISATGDRSNVSYSALEPSSAEWYLQNLTELKISGQEGYIVRRLVAARKKAGFPLTKVLVAYDDEMDTDDEYWLRANVKEFGYFEASDVEDADEDMDPFGDYSDDMSLYDLSDGFADGNGGSEFGYSDVD
jgi:hypothetical protein